MRTWASVSSTKRLHSEHREKRNSSWGNRNLAVIFSLGRKITHWSSQAGVCQAFLMQLRIMHA